MAKLTLLPIKKSVEVTEGLNILDALEEQGLQLNSICGGCASCQDCIIEVVSGEDNLGPQTFEELKLLGNVYHLTKERLACQTKIQGDATIDVTGHAAITGEVNHNVEGANRAGVDIKPKRNRKKKKKKVVRRGPEEKQAVLEAKEKKRAEKKKKTPNGGMKRPRPFSFKNSEAELVVPEVVPPRGKRKREEAKGSEESSPELDNGPVDSANIAAAESSTDTHEHVDSANTESIPAKEDA